MKFLFFNYTHIHVLRILLRTELALYGLQQFNCVLSSPSLDANLHDISHTCTCIIIVESFFLNFMCHTKENSRTYGEINTIGG